MFKNITIGLCIVLSVMIFMTATAEELRELHGHVPTITAHLAPSGRLPAEQRLNLAVGLPLRNREALTNLLNDLYDPTRPLYHHYLSSVEFAERFGPADTDYQALIAFAQSNHFIVTGLHPNRVLLDVNASVSDIERAFHVTLRVYPHPSEARTFYAPDVEPKVGALLPILDIRGLDNYVLPHPFVRRASFVKPLLGANPRSGSGSGGTYMGNDFRAAYIPDATLTGAGQIVGLVQFDGFYSSDVTQYESQAGLPNVPLQTVLLDGYNGVPTTGANSGNIEVSLDIEMTISMAPGLSKVILYEAGPSGNPNDVLNRMTTDNLARQLSCSWGWSGGPTATTDQIFQQMDAQGQSFFNASGDSDAYTPGQIDNSSDQNTPSDNPYITIVGGTTLSTTGPGGAWVSETVWNWGNGTGSSGGISSHYLIPTWQQGINMSASQGSTSYRNIPDVAFTADNVLVLYGNGNSSAVGGTSCAAPLWAALIALANEQSAAGGKPPVGFINPAIYSIGKGDGYSASFHDTTSGNNFNSSSPNLFSAAPGFDLCTGWGTPNGSALINSLAPVVNAPVITAAGFVLLAESCIPTNGAVDPGETVMLSFGLQNSGTLSTTRLVATLLATNGVMAPTGPQVYGALVPMGAAVNQLFTFTANGTCGGTVTPTFQLQDGATNLGTVTFNIPLGKAIATAANQNFDGVTPPVLPSGWSSTAVSGTQTAWITTTAAYDTAPNSALIPDSINPSQNALVSPVMTLPPTSSQLTFRHNYNLEYHTSRRNGTTYFDGAVLEIQIGGGAFTDILAAGGSFAFGGYNGTITATSDNPLGGRSAWVGNSAGWVTTTVNLPPSAAGQNVQLRWNCATDTGNQYGGTGWYVDTISTSMSYYTCCNNADVAPAISMEPTNKTLVQGATAAFSVSASGTPPPGYQWRRNGASLPGATGSTLLLLNVQPTQAGSYTALVTNVSGSTTSSPAVLRVLVPPAVGSIQQSGARVSVTLSSYVGLNYVLEYKSFLTDPIWIPLAPSATGTGGSLMLQDTNPPAQHRFYRVRCE